MTVRRRGSSATVGAGSSVAASVPAAVAGDLLFAYVGGGNQVTSYSGGWVSVQHTTGVEAQGELLTRVATGDSGDDLSLTFDGGDPYRVVVAAYYSTAGHSLDYQIVSTTRQGTLSGTLPAVSFTIPYTGANPGNLLDTYIFTRNGTAPVTVAPGSELHSYSASHPYGFWEDTHPEQATEIAVDLPVRTGHFRATVRIFEWEWLPWRNDSVPFSTGTVAYVNPVTTEGGVASGRVGGGEHVGLVEGIDDGAQHDSVTAAWAETFDNSGGGTFSPEFTGIVRLSAGHYQSRTNFNTFWLTAVRSAAPPGVTSGNLPPSVYTGGDYVDPLVFGQEWEPADAPAYNDVAVTVRTVSGFSAVLGDHLGRPLHLKIVTSGIGSGVYDPTAMSANALAAMPDWHTLDVPADWADGDSITGAWSDHGMPVDDEGGRFAVAIVDDFTQTHTYPPTYSGPAPTTEFGAFEIKWAFEVSMEAYFAPRYRLKREIPGIESVIRQWPRDDSLGVNSVARAWPPPRGARVIGGQP